MKIADTSFKPKMKMDRLKEIVEFTKEIYNKTTIHAQNSLWVYN